MGDVITYRPPPGAGPDGLVTHRIAAITRDERGARVFRTKGDANPAADPWTFTLSGERQARVARRRALRRLRARRAVGPPRAAARRRRARRC